MSNTPLTEAEASLMLTLAERLKGMVPIMADYVTRITHEWLEARRAVGIEPYGPENLLEVLEARRHEREPR